MQEKKKARNDIRSKLVEDISLVENTTNTTIRSKGVSCIGTGRVYFTELMRVYCVLKLRYHYRCKISGMKALRGQQFRLLNVLPVFGVRLCLLQRFRIYGGGVDIHWHMYCVPFAIQCKNYRKKIGPSIVRELIGALALISYWVLSIIVIPSKKISLNGRRVDTYAPVHVELQIKLRLYLQI
ncbi:hypothetical protein F8M41_017834 [Gigaspora margarita]|uniref:Uncharacterized protein n=1 Tax=Gigaspora margarita TaxID=4874 RepID=A0A8H4ELV8_GIGMA|nr:hypothetical protein F8M41_017834 [Gigaspora margarita]